MNLTPLHKEILETIGLTGASSGALRRNGREFGELERQGLIVFWPERGLRPQGIYGGGMTPGRWYLTVAGFEKVHGEGPPLRLAP